jgi:acyl-CoA thioester hydrolase
MIELNSSNFLTASETLRVPFHDLDPGGVVWHGRYFKYFERARCTLFEGIDYSYKEMKKSGFLWPVVDTKVRYVRPLLLDQDIRVTACLREWELRLIVDYRIVDEQGVKYTKARTVQVPIDAETLELQFGSPEILVQNVQARLQALTTRND